VVITLIGEEPMAQPQVTAVETEAIATAEKVTEHHGKQYTKPNFQSSFYLRPSPAKTSTAPRIGKTANLSFDNN